MTTNWTNEAGSEVRRFSDGDWYWVPKMIIRQYAPEAKPLGIAVYDFLASLADSDQRCYPSQRYIAECLGCSRASVNRAIKRLEKNKLTRIQRRKGSSSVYFLLRVRCSAGEQGVTQREHRDVALVNINDNKIPRIYKNDTIARDASKSISTYKDFQPQSREELLALDLAQSLNDRKGLALYLNYAKKYPEQFLRQILGEVNALSSHKIKKSRGALFTFLVKRYGERSS